MAFLLRKDSLFSFWFCLASQLLYHDMPGEALFCYIYSRASKMLRLAFFIKCEKVFNMTSSYFFCLLVSCVLVCICSPWQGAQRRTQPRTAAFPSR